MEISTICLLVLMCTAASFVQRVCGFGFGVFIMTMLPYLCPSYGEATAISGILAASQSAYVLASCYKLVDWRRIVLLLITGIVAAWFAVGYVAQASESHLKMMLGIILILLSLYFLFISPNLHVRPTWRLQASMGALSGAMGGLFGMHGPAAVIYLLAIEPDKNRYLALGQAYFLLTNIFLTAFRAYRGFVTPFVGTSCLYALVGVVGGTLLGKLVFDRISSEKLRKIIYLYMIFSGIVAIIN